MPVLWEVLSRMSAAIAGAVVRNSVANAMMSKVRRGMRSHEFEGRKFGNGKVSVLRASGTTGFGTKTRTVTCKRLSGAIALARSVLTGPVEYGNRSSVDRQENEESELRNRNPG